VKGGKLKHNSCRFNHKVRRGGSSKGEAAKFSWTSPKDYHKFQSSALGHPGVGLGLISGNLTVSDIASRWIAKPYTRSRHRFQVSGS
jgi:hypothetical protein